MVFLKRNGAPCKLIITYEGLLYIKKQTEFKCVPELAIQLFGFTLITICFLFEMMVLTYM